MKHVEKQPDFVWEIDCTTSSNVQRARNRHRTNGHLGQMDTLGPMSFEASGHWGQMGNLGQIGIWDIGGMGDWDK